MYNIEQERIDSVMRICGVNEDVARIALQYNQGDIGRAIHSMPNFLYRYQKEAKEIKI